jgi:hypothetical protein
MRQYFSRRRGRTGADGRARTDGRGRTGADGRARTDGPGGEKTKRLSEGAIYTLSNAGVWVWTTELQKNKNKKVCARRELNPGLSLGKRQS